MTLWKQCCEYEQCCEYHVCRAKMRRADKAVVQLICKLAGLAVQK
jgi:cob(I)alamin adenosyltransferase